MNGVCLGIRRSGRPPLLRKSPIVLHPQIWLGEWRYADIGILDRTHRRFFTRRCILDLIEGARPAFMLVEGINARGFHFWLKTINPIGNNFLDDLRYVQFAVVGVKPGV